MPSPDPAASVSPQRLVTALVAESAKKSRVCWLSWPDGPGRQQTRMPRLVWHGWYDDALVVLSGDEQELTDLSASSTARVVMRSKDTGGRLVGWSGSVTVVDPASAPWEDHANALLGVRLNLADPAATLAAWRTNATIVRIVPADATVER